MPQSLGTIWVDLQANIGGFVSALSKAAAEAQKTSKEISRSFRDLGEIASQTFGAFGEELNPIVSKLSFVISSAGSAASSAMKEFQKMGGGFGALAALGAGAAIGVAAAGATMVGIAVHAAESAEKLLELSRSTGVSVESLSALQFAARQTGIDQAQLVKSLQLLSSNMVKAAEAPKGAATAFSRLGLNIRQQNGDLKNAAQFMGEVIAKLSEMRDKTAAVGEARQLMGRGGAAILQLGDPAEIEHWIEAAQRLNVVVDTQTAVAAEHFMQTLGLIRGAAEGTANRIMADLLPALQAVATQLEKSATSGNSFGKDFLKTIETVIKGTIAVGQTWGTAFEQIGLAIKAAGADLMSFIDLLKSTSQLSLKSLVPGAVGAQDFAAAKHAFSDFLDSRKANIQLFNADSKKLWQQNSDFIENVFGPRAPWTLDHRGDKGTDNGLGSKGGAATGGRPDIVAELIAKLQTQAAAELSLAAATEKSAAATLLAKAAAEAEIKIGETRAHLLEREKELRERLASEPDSKHAPTIQAEIDDVKKMVEALDKAAPQMKASYAEIAAAGFAVKASKDLESFINKTTEATAALREMAAAYDKGPEAVAGAQVSAKLAPFDKQLADMRELIARMKDLHIPTGSVGSVSVIGNLFGNMEESANKLEVQIARARKAEEGLASEEIAAKLKKTERELTSQAEAYGVIAAAALKSAAAQREAAAGAAAIKFKTENPVATAPQIAQVKQQESAKLDQERASEIAKEAAAQFDLNASFAQEIKKLQEIRSFLQSSGESTIAIDTKIYETKIQHTLDYQKQVFESQNQELLGEQKIYQMGVQLTEEWDRAANEVGTLGQKFRAMINEVELQGGNIGGKLFESMGKAFEDLSSTLSKFIVTGKNGFRQMIESWEENLVKLSLQKTFSLILGKVFGAPQTPGQESGQEQNGPWSEQVPGVPGAAGKGGLGGIAGAIGTIFGIKLPGAAGAKKPAGTSTDPLYVVLTNAAAAAGGTSAGGAASAFSGLSGLPVVGGIFTDFGKIFGGQGTSSTGKPDGSQSNPVYTINSTGGPAAAGGTSSLFSDFLSMFRGKGSSSGPEGVSEGSGFGDLFSGLGSGDFGGEASGGGDDGGDSGGGAASILTTGLGIVGGIAKAFGGGGAGKPDGSKSNPFYTISAGARGSGSGGGGLLGGILSAFSGGGGGGGGDVSGAELSMMAGGGRVSKGTPYIVGEKNAEVFVPDQHGKIVPSIAHFANSPEAKAMKFRGVSLSAMSRREYGGSVTANMPYLTGEKRPEVFVPDSASSSSRPSRSPEQGGNHTHVHLEFPNVRDHDNWKKSSAQIHSEMQHQAAIAYQRNR
jgi:hypothetical protein